MNQFLVFYHVPNLLLYVHHHVRPAANFQSVTFGVSLKKFEAQIDFIGVCVCVQCALHSNEEAAKASIWTRFAHSIDIFCISLSFRLWLYRSFTVSPISITSVRTINMLYFLLACLMVTAKIRRKFAENTNLSLYFLSIFSRCSISIRWMCPILLVQYTIVHIDISICVWCSMCKCMVMLCVSGGICMDTQINDNGSPSRPYKHTYMNIKRTKERKSVLSSCAHPFVEHIGPTNSELTMPKHD